MLLLKTNRIQSCEDTDHDFSQYLVNISKGISFKHFISTNLSQFLPFQMITFTFL